MPQLVNPDALWALAVVPFVALVVWSSYRRRQSLTSQYCAPEFKDKLAFQLSGFRHLIKGVLVCLMVSALIVACARPSVETSQAEFPRGTVDVVAVVDVSRSMATLAYKNKLPMSTEEHGTCLDMARQVMLSRLMPQLQGNQLGIVSYAGGAFPQAFLSDDLTPLKYVMNSAMKISSAPGEGSDIAKAFDMALTLFDADSPDGHERIIVLFSDGGNDSGEDALKEVADKCRKYRGGPIKVVVVGMGSTNPIPILIEELAPDDPAAQAHIFNGKTVYEEDGEVVRTGLNEGVLIWLAKTCGGTYKRMTTASDMDVLSMSRTKTTVKKKGSKELFSYPMMVAVASGFLVLLITRERRSFLKGRS